MESTVAKSSRIAKNTALLYIRMLLIIIVNIFMSRIVLKLLGIQDYGIYNVIGGMVLMFSLLTASLSTAISRYITFALGQGNKERLKVVFSTSFLIQGLMALIVLVITEVAGLWFLNTSLNIPEERMYAAQWVFHCSVIIFVARLLGVPFNAAIIAHERMGVFAFISIIEALLTLLLVLLLSICSLDKLIAYSIILSFVAVVVQLLYICYCRYSFVECRVQNSFDKGLFKEISGFAGWNLMGTGATLFNTQGINIVTNIVFDVTVNAARGVADQVQSLVMQFVNNFTTAFNPQITKSYASHEYEYLFMLIYKGAKFSYYLMLIFIVPFMFEIEIVLDIWLGEYPSYAPIFIRLSLIASMIDFLGNQTARAVWATGNVKKYYLTICSISFLVFPISFLLFKIGFAPYWSYAVFILCYVILVPLRLNVLHSLLPEFEPITFYKEVIVKIIPPTIGSFTIPLVAYVVLPRTIISAIVVLLLSIISTLFFVYSTGMTKNERLFMTQKVKSFLRLGAENQKIAS